MEDMAFKAADPMTVAAYQVDEAQARLLHAKADLLEAQLRKDYGTEPTGSTGDAAARLLSARADIARAEADKATQPSMRFEGLQVVVDRISELERQRDEAVARADVATYTSEALAARCKKLQEKLAAVRAPMTRLSVGEWGVEVPHGTPDSVVTDLKRRVCEAQGIKLPDDYVLYSPSESEAA